MKKTIIDKVYHHQPGYTTVDSVMPDTSVKRGGFINRLGSPRTRHAVGKLPTQSFHVAPSDNLCIWRNS